MADGRDHSAEGSQTGEAAARLTRRKLLKTTVAAGAGTLAWTGPQIGRMGKIPAYAQVTTCKAPVTTYDFGKRNTDCGGCSGSVRYKPPNPTSVPVFPGTVVLVEGSCSNVAGNSGSCPLPSSDAAGLCLSATSVGTCKVRVTVYDNSGGIILATAYTGAITPTPGGQYVPLPNIACVGGGDKFWRAEVICSTDVNCLP